MIREIHEDKYNQGFRANTESMGERRRRKTYVNDQSEPTEDRVRHEGKDPRGGAETAFPRTQTTPEDELKEDVEGTEDSGRKESTVIENRADGRGLGSE